MRLPIRWQFGLDTGHEHAGLKSTGPNYVIILDSLGRSEAEIQAGLAPVEAECRPRAAGFAGPC